MSDNNPEDQEKFISPGFTPEEYLEMSINELVKRTVYVGFSENSNTDGVISRSYGPELAPDQDYEPK